MESVLIPKITSSPSLIWVVAAIGFYILNIFLGLFMAFRKKTAQSLRIHRMLFYTIAFCLGYYLIMNQTHDDNTLLDYLICIYCITIVPFSKRWDVLIHAFIGAMGLILPAATYCFKDIKRSDEEISRKKKYLKGQSWIAALTVMSP